MRKRSLDMVYELAKKDDRIVFIGSDLGAGTLDNFRREIPDRFFMEGVSEANIVGMAAGMALEGRIVYVNTIATFLSRRCYEQVVLDLGLHDVNVRLIANGGGVVYAPLGPTHLAIDDLAIMRAVPNMTIVAPCDADEMSRLMPLTVDHHGPIYIRLGKGGDPIVSKPEHGFQIGKAIQMTSGSDVLLVTTGITLKIALEAADALNAAGVGATVLHMHTVKPLDADAVLSHAARVQAVVTIEEHTIVGGLGGAVAEVLAEAGVGATARFKRIGLPDVFPHGYGSQASMMAQYGITAERTVAAVNSLLAVRTA
ncbi:MAG TPA: transketolase C-terminal domain-containing protein [Vicinamibacterales bacterium]|nr:transketolase C-terminal domain-containing protein [Vicinamibacterales bacterium]